MINILSIRRKNSGILSCFGIDLNAMQIQDKGVSFSRGRKAVHGVSVLVREVRADECIKKPPVLERPAVPNRTQPNIASSTGLVCPPGYITYSSRYTITPVNAVMNQVTEVVRPHLRWRANRFRQASARVVMPNTAAAAASTMWNSRNARYTVRSDSGPPHAVLPTKSVRA